MPTLVSEVGIRYLSDLRSPQKEVDPEVTKVSIELPEVPKLTKDNNPCKYDLVFICSDGIVYSHRVVIANASKYIMHLMDGQPHWYPTYIHVLDLPRYIVQLLVNLSYTGEMRFPEELQNDVFDAMQTLGWVHTDCLSANYDVESGDYVYNAADFIKSPKKDEQPKNEDVPSKEVVKSPQRTTAPAIMTERSKRNSFVDDEDSMDVPQIPDMEWSDVDDDKEKDNNKKMNSPKKSNSSPSKTAEATPEKRPTRKSKSKVTQNDNNIDENEKPTKKTENSTSPMHPPAAKHKGRPSSTSSTPTSETTNNANNDEAAENVKPKRGRKKKEVAQEKKEEELKIEETPTPMIPANDDISNQSSNDLVPESPNKRQRKKPKRFEEYEELDKPKPRASPIKPSPVKSTPKKKNSLEKGEAKTDEKKISLDNEIPSTSSQKSTTDESIEIKISTHNNEQSSQDSNSKGKPKRTVRRKLSDEAPKSSLITSYFAKKPCTKASESESENATDDVEIIEHEKDNSQSAAKLTPSRRSSRSSVKSKSDEQELLNHTEEKRDNKKRSFDDIRSSHIDEKVESISPQDNNKEPESVEQSDKNSVDPKIPSRKSSRCSSKAQSTDGSEDIVPKRKKTKNDSTTSEVVTNDGN